MIGAALGVKYLWKNTTTLNSHRPKHGKTTRCEKTRVAGGIKVTAQGRFKVMETLNIALMLEGNVRTTRKGKKKEKSKGKIRGLMLLSQVNDRLTMDY